MKRKILLCTLIISTLLLGGCTQKNNTTQEKAPTVESTTPSNTDNKTQTNTTQNNSGNYTTESTMITEENAKEIALNHARLTSDSVTFIKSSLDKNDTFPHYDVEFYGNDNIEYDYEIDPYTGEILEYDHDMEHNEISSVANTENIITEEDAKQIALNKTAGATVSDIHEFKLDSENNRPVYEGKIIYEQTEYDFEIDAKTGEIIEWDVESIHR